MTGSLHDKLVLIFEKPYCEAPFEVVHQLWPFEIVIRHNRKGCPTIQNEMMHVGKERVWKHFHFRWAGRVRQSPNTHLSHLLLRLLSFTSISILP